MPSDKRSSMFKPPLARVTPVKPPTVNKKIKPRANNNAVLRLAPHKVANQLKILIPVGTAIIMVAAVK
jgi:hypothetical protein